MGRYRCRLFGIGSLKGQIQNLINVCLRVLLVSVGRSQCAFGLLTTVVENGLVLVRDAKAYGLTGAGTAAY